MRDIQTQVHCIAHCVIHRNIPPSSLFDSQAFDYFILHFKRQLLPGTSMCINSPVLYVSHPPPLQCSELGDVQVSLNYNPSLQRLTLEVLRARGLQLLSDTGEAPRKWPFSRSALVGI